MEVGKPSVIKKVDFFPVQDGSMEELRIKIRNLEAQLKEKDIFANRDHLQHKVKDGVTSSQVIHSDVLVAGKDKEKEEVLNTLLVKGFYKENSRLMNENTGLKGIVSEMRKGLGQVGLHQEGPSSAELKETIARLQSELGKKDTYYRGELEKYRVKADSVEGLTQRIKMGEDEIIRLRRIEDMCKDELANLRQKHTDNIRNFKLREEELNHELSKAHAFIKESPPLAIQNTTPAAAQSTADPFKPADFNLTQTNPHFNPSDQASPIGTRFGNMVDPYYYNKSNEVRFNPPLKNIAQPDENLRASVLAEPNTKDYDLQKDIVKSVLQKLPKGNPYQIANDLIDTSLIMFTKKLDKELDKAFQELKSVVIGLDERLDVDGLEELIRTAIMQLGDKDDKALSKTLLELDKAFVEKMFFFLPEYLNHTRMVKLLPDGSSTTEGTSFSPELHKLKHDNEKLKRDIECLKEQKHSLEKVIEYLYI